MRTDHFVDLEIWRDNIKIRFKEVGCELDGMVQESTRVGFCDDSESMSENLLIQQNNSHAK
jgi:hypothetical protein